MSRFLGYFTSLGSGIIGKSYFLMMIIFIAGCHSGRNNAQHNLQATTEFPILDEGNVEALDTRIWEVLSNPSVKLEILAKDHDWTEGPLWIESEQLLLYSDIPRNSIYSWSKESGSKLYLKPSGFLGENFAGEEPGSNGLLLDPEGYLVLCQHGERQIVRMKSPLAAPRPEFEVLVNNYEGKRLNSPNDAVYKSNGDLYFTDPPYGLPKRMENPEKELSFQGVYRLDTAGNLTLLTSELTRPNGLAFSPDEKILYVANSDPDLAIWKSYPVLDDGSIGPGKVLFDATERVEQGGAGLPDGMTVDQNGNLFATGPGGIFIFDPVGDLLGLIHTGQATSNCTFNIDQTDLYITADMYLLRMKIR